MYEQDMMLRYAEITAKVILKILGLKEAGNWEEAKLEIQQTGLTYFGLSVNDIALLPKENLWEFLQNQHKLDVNRIDAFADLVKAQAEIFAAQGKEAESLDYYEKALLLWEGVSQADKKVFSFDRFYKMKALKEKLS
jgi:tetratricopeptide (TPR) repeat protein